MFQVVSPVTQPLRPPRGLIWKNLVDLPSKTLNMKFGINLYSSSGEDFLRFGLFLITVAIFEPKKSERGSPRDLPFKISSKLAKQFQRRSRFSESLRTDGRTTRHPISSAGLWPVELKRKTGASYGCSTLPSSNEQWTFNLVHPNYVLEW